MFNNLKLSTKITFGFAIIMTIMLLLGAIATYHLVGIRSGANKLAAEYVPEVTLATSTDATAQDVLFAMRGFAYTEEKPFYDEATTLLKKLQEILEKADQLAKTSEHLKVLREEIPKIKDHLKKYEEFATRTGDITTQLQDQRKNMDKNAADYTTNLNALIAEQTKQLNADISVKASPEKLRSELSKVTKLNEILDLGNKVRILNFKAQATRSPETSKQALAVFPEIHAALEEFLSTTTNSQLKSLLTNTQTAAKGYEGDLAKFLELWLQREEVNKLRLVEGDQVSSLATATSNAGLKQTTEIAAAANADATLAVTVLLFGLLAAFIIAVTAAVIIIRNITIPIRLATVKLAQGNAIITEIAGQLSSASQQLSSSSNEQASSVEETSSSLEQLAGMVENNVANARKAAELSGKVKEVAEVGNNSMKQLEQSMTEILHSNEKIEQLVKLIENIAEKTQVMDEIVFQTKLLSFNASVEAERAGEHGRGFAVVAQEVGNLAQMSGKSASEIATIVRTSIKDAEMITRENRAKVEEGNKFVTDTAKILAEITESARTVEDGARQVLNASQDQSKGLKEVSAAMNEIDKSTQENASTSEETASSAEELASQVNTMNEIVIAVTRLIEGHSAVSGYQQHESAQSKASGPKATFHPTAKKPGHTPSKVAQLSEHRHDKTAKPTTASHAPVKKAAGAEELSTGADNDDWQKL